MLSVNNPDNLGASAMRIMEILLYQADGPTELGDADTEMMQHLGDLFTRRGVVKALTGFGSAEHIPSQPEMNGEKGKVPVCHPGDPLQAPLSSAEWHAPATENPGLRRSTRYLPVCRPY